MSFPIKVSSLFVLNFFLACAAPENEILTPKIFELVSNPNLTVEETPRNFKVAFLGDTGRERGYERVLELVKHQGAELVVHVGDFSYGYNQRIGAEDWHAVLNKVLGKKFPYFMLVGNHEEAEWSKYSDIFYERLQYLPPKTCYVDRDISDLGVKSYCLYKGIFFVLSGVGTKGTFHASFIENALDYYKKTPWKVCGWHKNQASLQVGIKGDEVGWKPFKICQKYGAFITMGHEHSYVRTKTLTNFNLTNPEYTGEDSLLTLGPGKTFSAVVGTGGKSVRPYNCQKGELAPWFSSLFTSNYIVTNRKTVKEKNCSMTSTFNDQDTTEFGALFMTFNLDGNANEARGEFVTTRNRVLDNFIVKSE